MGVLFASALRNPATYNSDFVVPRGYRGILVHINYTAEGGAGSTLDFKLQYYDPASDTFEDLARSLVERMAGVGEIDLMLYPGIVAIANREVNIAVPRKLRAVAVVGITSVTFSAHSQALE